MARGQVTWVWPVSETEAEYIAEAGLALCFPPGQPVEIRVIEEVADDA